MAAVNTPFEIVIVLLSGLTIPRVEVVAVGSTDVLRIVDGEEFIRDTTWEDVAADDAVVDVAYGIPVPENGPDPDPEIIEYGIVDDPT